MAGANFNLRGMLPEVMTILQQKAQERHISVNTLILKLVERGVGYSREIDRPCFHELDHLAGTWSAEDKKSFEKNTEYFEQVDEEMW